MALEMNDLMALKSLSSNEMTPYEQFKVSNMQTKNHTSGLGIAGLTVGVGAAVLAIGGAAWAGSRAQNAKDVAIAKYNILLILITVSYFTAKSGNDSYSQQLIDYTADCKGNSHQQVCCYILQYPCSSHSMEPYHT